MTPDVLRLDVPERANSPRLLRSNVEKKNVVLPDFPHRAAGALFDAWPDRSSLCITTLARLVRFPKGDAKRVAAVAVSENDVADVARLAADAGMDDFAHDSRNIVDPVAVIAEWGVDAFRFYVLRELDIGPDGNWTDAGFKARYQAELANGLGNLVNRSLSMLKRYRNGVVPQRSDELAAEANKFFADTRTLLEKNHLQAALQMIWSLVTRANQYVDHTAPFKLAKDPAQAKRLDEVLYNLAETCRVLAVLLWPFLPGTACRIFAQLGLNTAPDKLPAASWGGLQSGHVIGQPEPLFPRKEVE